MPKMSWGSDLIALARSKAGQWYYTNEEWARMHPEESGGTDCSGFARWCYLQFGIDIGTYTGNESQAGYEIARGHYPWEIPWDIMEPGDLILMTARYWNLWSFDEYYCHIELYCGNGTMIGHPSGYGPQEKWAQAWMDAYGCITWMVRRVFEGDEMITDNDIERIRSAILGFKNPNMYIRKTSENIDVYQDAWNASHQLTRTDNAGWKTPDGHDMFGRVNAIQQDVAEMKSAIAKLSVGGAEIDYDKLAAKLAPAVADEFHNRMKN